MYRPYPRPGICASSLLQIRSAFRARSWLLACQDYIAIVTCLHASVVLLGQITSDSEASL